MKRSRDEEAPPLPPPQHRADPRAAPLSPLHHAIVDWCHRHSPSASENHARDETQQQIERVVAGIWPTGTVHAFGSGATGLNSTGGDIDLVILGTGVHTEDPAGLSAAEKRTVQDQLIMLKQGLERAQIATSMEAVLSARVSADSSILGPAFRSSLCEEQLQHIVSLVLAAAPANLTMHD